MSFRNWFTRIFAIPAIAIMFLGVSGCGESAKKDKLDAIIESKKLVVYTSPDFPPFEYMEGEKITGIEIELAREIAKEIGVELEIKSAEFDGIIASIASGKGDLSLSNFTKTEERQEQVDFSDFYFSSSQSVIFPKGADIKTIESLKGKKVATPLGYTGHKLMEKELAEGSLKESNTTILPVNNSNDAVLELKNKKVDSVVVDEYVAREICREHSELTYLPLTYSDGQVLLTDEVAAIMPKGNPKLLAAVNAAISKILKENKVEEWVTKYGG